MIIKKVYKDNFTPEPLKRNEREHKQRRDDGHIYLKGYGLTPELLMKRRQKQEHQQRRGNGHRIITYKLEGFAYITAKKGGRRERHKRGDDDNFAGINVDGKDDEAEKYAEAFVEGNVLQLRHADMSDGHRQAGMTPTSRQDAVWPASVADAPDAHFGGKYAQRNVCVAVAPADNVRGGKDVYVERKGKGENDDDDDNDDNDDNVAMANEVPDEAGRAVAATRKRLAPCMKSGAMVVENSRLPLGHGNGSSYKKSRKPDAAQKMSNNKSGWPL